MRLAVHEEPVQSEPAQPITDAEMVRIVQTAVNPFCLIDEVGNVLWAGTSVEEILGVPADELVGQSMLEYLSPESIEHAIQSLAAARDYVSERSDAPGWDGLGPVVQIVRPDGVEVSCSVAVATPVRTGLQGFVLQLRRSDAAYALENALIAMGKGRSLLEVMHEVASMLEGELPAAEVAVFRRYRGTATHDALIGPEALGTLLAGEALAGTPWEAAFATPGEVVERSIEELPSPLRGVAAGHGFRWMALMVVPPTDDGESPAVVVIWSRHGFPMHVFTHERVRRCGSLVALVIQWERGQRALQWAATHDVLTGLHNRSYFLDELEELPSAIGNGQHGGVAVLYLDLDDFKPVNDQHGHHVGDHVLIEVANRLRSCVRPSDVVARLGGDEFAVLCRGFDDVVVAEQLAARLVTDVAKPMVVDGIHLQVGLSVGLALLVQGDDPATLLDRADTALRTAKVDGKRRWKSGLAPPGVPAR